MKVFSTLDDFRQFHSIDLHCALKEMQYIIPGSDKDSSLHFIVTVS